MEHTRDDARDLLAQARATQQAVEARAAWDYRGYLAWALWLLIFLPPLDFLGGHRWGAIVTATSTAGTILTAVYFSSRARQVHLGRAMQIRRWIIFWAAWTVWFVAIVVGANLLHGHLEYRWSVAGIAGALPCLVAGYLSWRSR